MAGLNSLLQDTKNVTTELPSWYNTASQTAAQGAQAGAAAGLTPAQTVGQSAVQQFGSDSPFQNAQGYLQDIAHGATNPWLTDAQGNVSGNTATPLGGLYEAQKQYFNQILPEIDASATAPAIVSGNFGSLRGLTALQKARGDALAKMRSDQLQNALQAQQVGTQASSALGNVGAQNVENALKTAQWQQVAPIAPYSALANTLSALKPQQNQATKTNISPLAQAQTLGKLIDSPAATSILSKFGVTGANVGDKMGSLYDKLFGGGTRTGGGGSPLSGGNFIPLADGGAMQFDPATGAKTVFGADGSAQTFDRDGNLINEISGADRQAQENAQDLENYYSNEPASYYDVPSYSEE